MTSWTIDSFQLLGDLGRGSFGLVYRAREKSTGVMVVLKIIQKKQISSPAKMLQLKRQIQIHSRLVHKHICQMHGHFQDQNNIYMVLQYCPDGMLFQYRKTLLPQPQISSMLRQLTLAICYLQQRFIIHRDLKLENIMLSGNQLKIIDFGWCVHTVKPRLTVCGTLEYLSPEMLFNREYDNSVDVYCLGIVLYELLYLRSPFYEESEADIMKNIKEGVLLFFDNIRNASDQAKDLVQQLLKTQPKERIKAKDILQHPFITKYLVENTSPTSSE